MSDINLWVDPNDEEIYLSEPKSHSIRFTPSQIQFIRAGFKRKTFKVPKGYSIPEDVKKAYKEKGVDLSR